MSSWPIVYTSKGQVKAYTGAAGRDNTLMFETSQGDEAILKVLKKVSIGLIAKFETCSLSSLPGQINSKPLLLHIDTDSKYVKSKGVKGNENEEY